MRSTSQVDTDGDGRGDDCDADDDNDGTSDLREQLVGANPRAAASRAEFLGMQSMAGVSACADGVDNDGDGKVDAGDNGCTDSDGDTMADVGDNCPNAPNYGWRDAGGNGKG